MFCVCILIATHNRHRRSIASSAWTIRYLAARFASSSGERGVGLGVGLAFFRDFGGGVGVDETHEQWRLAHHRLPRESDQGRRDSAGYAPERGRQKRQQCQEPKHRDQRHARITTARGARAASVSAAVRSAGRNHGRRPRSSGPEPSCWPRLAPRAARACCAADRETPARGPS